MSEPVSFRVIPEGANLNLRTNTSEFLGIANDANDGIPTGLGH